MGLNEVLGRAALKLIFYPKYHFVFSYDDFDRKRKDPYLLIGNHASFNDAIYIELKLKKYVYPVTSNIVFTNPFFNFLLTKIIKSIAKRKGQSDVQTIRGILNAINKDHHGVTVYPEGNASYFGKETKVSMTSTAKLIKKIKLDVVVAKVSGGYLSHPRWGKQRKKGDYHIHYYTLIHDHEIENLSVEKIETMLEEAIAFNDYDWNREKQIVYRSKEKAEGLERYVYYCPVCHGYQTIKTKGNDISCSHCGHLATINPYEFLEGLPFDNLIEWDKLQKKEIPKIVEQEIYSKGKLMELDFNKGKRILMGFYDITLNKSTMKLSNVNDLKVFEIAGISGMILAQQNFLTFDYEGKTFMIAIDDPMLFKDTINYIKGE